VVVLPAGGARAFAHAGVLRALAEAKIPIGAIVASELGSLVGALFVTSPTLNEFEWNLQRFPNELFALDTSLVKLLRPGSKRKELKKRLLEVLGQKNGEGLSPPLYTLLPRGSTGELVSVGTALSLGVEAGIGLPGDESELSYAGAQLMPVSLARGLDIGPVIFVDLDRDAEGGPRSGVNPAEASRADLIIQPELAGVLATDYGKRSEIIYRGKQATRKLIPKIREALNGPGEGT
jgi:NTE family protein